MPASCPTLNLTVSSIPTQNCSGSLQYSFTLSRLRREYMKLSLLGISVWKFVSCMQIYTHCKWSYKVIGSCLTVCPQISQAVFGWEWACTLDWLHVYHRCSSIIAENIGNLNQLYVLLTHPIPAATNGFNRTRRTQPVQKGHILNARLIPL